MLSQCSLAAPGTFAGHRVLLTDLPRPLVTEVHQSTLTVLLAFRCVAALLPVPHQSIPFSTKCECALILIELYPLVIKLWLDWNTLQ